MSAASLPLIANYQPAALLAWHQGEAITQGVFLRRAVALAQQLPAGSFAINLCRDRYYFMLGFCAALMRGCSTLLPPNRQAQTVREIAEHYRGSFCVSDSGDDVGLEAINIAALNPQLDDDPALPGIPRQLLAAIAFTSGSTGKPVANAKTMINKLRIWRMFCASGFTAPRDCSHGAIAAYVRTGDDGDDGAARQLHH